MSNKIGKINLETLSKKELASLARSLSHGTYVVDGLWFQAVERLSGLEEATSLDERVWSIAAAQEGKRIKKFMSIPDGLAGLAKAFNFHVMFLSTEYEVTQPSDDVVVFTVTNCKPQTARIDKGLGENPCKRAGIPCMTAFAQAIDSRAVVKCIVCPPDPHPKDIWCQWEFTLRSNKQ
jgi:hypothetical protein